MKKTILITLLSLAFIGFAFADSSYVVQKGDTLYQISKKYQLTVAELRAANNLSENDVIKIGQKLVIPEADISTAAALSTTKTQSGSSAATSKTVTYEVQKGDTLYGIAKKKNMTVAQLLTLNNLDSTDVIKIGQKLKVYETTSAPAASSAKNTASTASGEVAASSKVSQEPTPDTRTYGSTIKADSNTKWPVKNPVITSVKGKVSGVQLSAKENESVVCIHEGTVMYVGVYRGFGQVLFIQTKTGLIYAYTGMGSISVHKGDYVVSGDNLGVVGVDSISGKPQLTFMVFQNGQPINPATAPRT